MTYQVLARKYRPQRFADVIGQDHVTQTLLNALAQDRIAHGYIFSGHRGIGKTTIARILAMALECRTPIGSESRPTPEPCGSCDACIEIRGGSAIDVIEIDAATNRGIDEIRELREGARYSPARDRYKIYILDEAHQITDAAFNALLKTLEEPPAHVIFMMATTQPEDIPQTIRSRCQHFSFHAVRFHEIVDQLRQIAQKESVIIDEPSLSMLAEAGDGSMRDALSIMDQAIASSPLKDGRHTIDGAQIRSLMGTVSNQVFEQIMAAVERQDAAAILLDVAQLLDAGNSPQQIARQMVRFLRNCLMARLAGENSDLLQVSHEEQARAGRVAAMFSEEDLTRFLNSMLRTFDELGYRQEQRFHLELGMLKLAHMRRLLPFEELFQQLTGGSAAASSGSKQPLRSVAPPALKASVPLTPLTQPLSKSLPATIAPTHRLVEVFATAAQPLASKQPASPAVQPEMQNIVSTSPTVAREQSDRSDKATTPLVERGTREREEASTGHETVTVELLQQEICRALSEGGHETAGTLFQAGVWEWDNGELRVRVGSSKTLFSMIYTTQAQQIVREAFRKITHSARAVRVEPSGTSNVDARPPAKSSGPTSGTAGQRPQDHPLIQHALGLFQAEVRSVVSLREPHS